MTNNKQQTAVEWLAERIHSDKIFNFENVLEQAKEMEKDKMIEFARIVLFKAEATFEGNVTTELTIDEYYEQTYINKK